MRRATAARASWRSPHRLQHRAASCSLCPNRCGRVLSQSCCLHAQPGMERQQGRCLQKAFSTLMQSDSLMSRMGSLRRQILGTPVVCFSGPSPVPSMHPTACQRPRSQCRMSCTSSWRGPPPRLSRSARPSWALPAPAGRPASSRPAPGAAAVPAGRPALGRRLTPPRLPRLPTSTSGPPGQSRKLSSLRSRCE